MVTSSLQLSSQVDGLYLNCSVGCAGSHTSLNIPKGRAVNLTDIWRMNLLIFIQDTDASKKKPKLFESLF